MIEDNTNIQFRERDFMWSNDVIYGFLDTLRTCESHECLPSEGAIQYTANLKGVSGDDGSGLKQILVLITLW